jgi:hypothetical protein
MIIIEVINVPDGLRQIIRTMYTFVECYVVVEGREFFAYYILSGVIQGCPLSGMLFAMAVDPFLRKMLVETETPLAAVVRACADDVGAALSGIEALVILKPTFDDARRFAGLTLKPRKCVLVPTAQLLNTELASQIKQWLVTHIPEWRDFCVKPVSTYLGFVMGPASNASQFDAPIKKWKSRSAAIANRHSSAAVSVAQYNRQALTVLGYKMQLTIPPKRMALQEMHVLSHVLHMAFGALDAAAQFNLDAAGGPKIRSVKALSFATLTRTAVKTLPSWQHDYNLLLVNDERPLETTRTGVLWATCWDSPAIASLLRHAARGFPENSRQSLGLDGKTWIDKDAAQIRAAVTETLASFLESPDRCTKIQNILDARLTDALYPPRLSQLFCLRLQSSLGVARDQLSEIDWTRLFEVLKSTSTHEAMCVIKTISNSWTTSARFHDGKLEHCCFGCRGARDDLAHYLCCCRLWTEVDIATGVDEDDLPDTAAQRMLLFGPSLVRARRLVVAYSVYHALKNGHLVTIQHAASSGDYGDVLVRTRALADAYSLKHCSRPLGGGVFRIATPALPHSSRDRLNPDFDHHELRPLCSQPVGADELDPREFCEPECSDLPAGTHHPGCSQVALEAENLRLQPPRTRSSSFDSAPN